jgi:hypothetical protein
MNGRFGAWLLLSALAICAHAAAGPPGAGPPVAGSPGGRSCTQIADNSARLACYDAAFGVKAATPFGADGSGTSATPAAVPAPVAAPRPAPEFGDRGQLHGQRETRAALPKRVNFKIKKAESLASGLFRLTMENGQVWVTKQADWVLEFKDGDEVTIQRMLTGSYRISHAGEGRDVTVVRVF